MAATVLDHQLAAVAIPNDRSRSLKLNIGAAIGDFWLVAIPNDRSRSLKLGCARRHLGGCDLVAIPNDRLRSLKPF